MGRSSVLPFLSPQPNQNSRLIWHPLFEKKRGVCPDLAKCILGHVTLRGLRVAHEFSLVNRNPFVQVCPFDDAQGWLPLTVIAVMEPGQ